MEIDDILYEAFAPQRLTEMFQKAKTLQLPSTKKLWGLDPGPVLKLCATVVMIGVMAGTSMKTQSQDLKDAGDALCGAHTCQCGCRATLPRHGGFAQAAGSTGRLV